MRVKYTRKRKPTGCRENTKLTKAVGRENLIDGI
jgi:hypothetical protein